MSRASAAAILLLLVATLGFPFLANPLQAIPGDPVLGESYLQPWSIWWVHRELREGVFPLWTDLLAFPQGGSFFSQMTWNALLLLPLAPLDLPSPLLLNLSLLLTLLLGAGSTWLLLEHLTRDRLAALVGTALFLTCPLLISFFRSGYLQGLNMVVLPLAWYLYLRMHERPTKTRTLAAAAGMAILFLANLYGALCAFLLVVLHCAWHRRFPGLFALLTALLGLPILLWIRHTLQVDPLVFASGGISNETFFQYANPDLVRFFLPVGRDDYFHLTECYYLGLAALAFASYPLLRKRPPTFYHVTALVGLVLALGPYLVVNGQFVLVDNHLVRLPFYYAWRHLPLFEVVRHPQRLMVLVYLALAIQIACNLRALRLQGTQRLGAALLVATLCVGEYLLVAPVVFPVPVLPAGPTDYSRFLAEQPGRFAVLALPYTTAFVQDAAFKHQQTFHGRSLQVGFDRRDPPQLDQIAFLQALRHGQTEGDFAEDAQRLARLGFRYVVLDRSLGHDAHAALLTRVLGSPREFRDGLVFPIPQDGSARRANDPAPVEAQ